jgi:hypothetical protein
MVLRLLERSNDDRRQQIAPPIGRTGNQALATMREDADCDVSIDGRASAYKFERSAEAAMRRNRAGRIVPSAQSDSPNAHEA